MAKRRHQTARNRARALDDLDKQIIVHLAEDGRKPYREIARALQVSEGTVRNRVGRLVDNDLIRITPVGNMLALGIEVVAAVHLRVRPGTAEKVARTLAKQPNIRFVAMTFGSADIILQILHKDAASLRDFINQELPRLAPDVTATETFQTSKMIKSAWTWGDWFEYQEN
jgi:Lrp/AsnC family transcriptional regulator for asnA, asnC and gidA